jgi:hypothetical protein
MLCDICSNLNCDELIPPAESLDAGKLSGTIQHASFSGLESAAKSGCDLCSGIMKLSSTLAKQRVNLDRMRRWPVTLKAELKNRNTPRYQGTSKLWVSCGGAIIAQFEVYVARGMITVIATKVMLTYMPLKTLKLLSQTSS